LEIDSFADIISINTTIKLGTEYIYKYDFSPSVAGPGKTSTVLSEDKMCSLQILKTTLYSQTLLWIEAVENSTPLPMELSYPAFTNFNHSIFRYKIR